MKKVLASTLLIFLTVGAWWATRTWDGSSGNSWGDASNTLTAGTFAMGDSALTVTWSTILDGAIYG
jgi:hypothetical protein